MKKQIYILWLLILALIIDLNYTTIIDATSWYFWRFRNHPTDVSSITDGYQYDLGVQLSDYSLWYCTNSSGGSEPSDWHKLSAEADTLDSVMNRGSSTDVSATFSSTINGLYMKLIGSDNIAISSVLPPITTGNNNVFLGKGTGYRLDSGYYNVFIGSDSGYYSDAGCHNVGVGAFSLYELTGGIRNVALGTNSLYGSTIVSNATAIGYNSGSRIYGVNPNNAIYLGAYAGYYETATDKLIIDSRDRTTEALSRSQAIIYGIMDDDVLDQQLTFNIGNLYLGSADVHTTGKIETGTVQYNTSPTIGSFSEGKTFYDSEFKTLAAEIGSDTTLQIGQETLVYCYNGTGSPITQGKAVYIIGASAGGVPSIALAKADSDTTSNVIGIVTTSSIAPAGNGFVTIRGHVNTLNTTGTPESETWNVGDILYLSSATAGSLTNVAPSSGGRDVRVARVMIKDASAGRIFVNVRPEYSLTNLSDVTITNPTLDQILRFNGTEFVNGAPSTSSTSSGIDFFFDDTSIVPITAGQNINEVNSLIKIPNSTSEVVDVFSCTNNTVLGEAYLWNTALGRTSIDGGIWTFNTYASVSSVLAGRISYLTRSINRVRPEAGTVTVTSTGTTRTVTASTGTPFAASKIDVGGTLITDSYLQTPKGLYRILSRVSDTEITIEVPSTYTNESTVAFSVWKQLFNVVGNTITSTGTNYQLLTAISTQVAFTVEATDKLGSIMFATSNNTTNISFVHNGTTHNSNFKTPLITLHGNLAGLQGGTGSVPSEQYYHLTLAQHTNVSNASATPSASIIPISSAGGKLDSWISDATTAAKGIASFNTNTFTVTNGAVSTKHSKSFVITNPTASADGSIWRTPVAITITAVHLLCIGNVVVGHLTEQDANGLNDAGVDGATDITGVAAENVNDDGALSNPSIDANDYLGWRTTSVTGTPTKAIITFEYTID